jgi:hypothetical protein
MPSGSSVDLGKLLLYDTSTAQATESATAHTRRRRRRHVTVAGWRRVACAQHGPPHIHRTRRHTPLQRTCKASNVGDVVAGPRRAIRAAHRDGGHEGEEPRPHRRGRAHPRRHAVRAVVVLVHLHTTTASCVARGANSAAGERRAARCHRTSAGTLELQRCVKSAAAASPHPAVYSKCTAHTLQMQVRRSGPRRRRQRARGRTHSVRRPYVAGSLRARVLVCRVATGAPGCHVLNRSGWHLAALQPTLEV